MVATNKKKNKFSNKNRIVVAAVVAVLLTGIGIYLYVVNTHASNADVITIAKTFNGTKESPAKSNKGTFINKWNKSVGCSVGDAWCASFVSNMLKSGHGGSESVYTCSTSTMISQFKNNHHVYSFKFDSLKTADVVYRSRTDGGHVGIVVSINRDAKTFKTIEGNTKCSESDNDCVRYHTYDQNGKTKDSDTDSNKWSKMMRW